MKKFWETCKSFARRVLEQLKDRRNILIFLIVFLVLSSEVWGFYLLAILTKNPWWWGIGSACWAFWLAPFLPLCFAVTFGVRKIFDRVRKRKEEGGAPDGAPPAESGRDGGDAEEDSPDRQNKTGDCSPGGDLPYETDREKAPDAGRESEADGIPDGDSSPGEDLPYETDREKAPDTDGESEESRESGGF